MSVGRTLQRISLAGRGLKELTDVFCQTYGDRVEELDLSGEAIGDLSPLRGFSRLRSLILNHNPVISSTTHFPRVPSLHTLWVNGCNIDNLALFLDRIMVSFPNLRFLSMLGCAACPNFLNGGTRGQYVDYRLYIVHKMPKIEFLEDEAVTVEQRDHALRKYGAAAEKPGLEKVLGRKKDKLSKKKEKRSQKYAVSKEPEAYEHPYARREALPIPGQSLNASDEWTTDSEDIEYWAGYVPREAPENAASQ